MLGIAVIEHVTVNPPPAQDGISWSSAIVFAGGVLAALGAVAASTLTARAAERRLEKTLVAERERSEIRERAEAERIERQLAHDRYLARRAEASTVIEGVTRIMASSGYRVLLRLGSSRKGIPPGPDELRELDLDLHRLGEEVDVVALRFGAGTPVTEAASRMSKALNAAFPRTDEIPFSQQREVQLAAAEQEVFDANNHFLKVAREAIDDYA